MITIPPVEEKGLDPVVTKSEDRRKESVIIRMARPSPNQKLLPLMDELPVASCQLPGVTTAHGCHHLIHAGCIAVRKVFLFYIYRKDVKEQPVKETTLSTEQRPQRSFQK